MNLALTEMALSKWSDAIPPASRAVELSREGAKGIDDLQARLVLEEAMLNASLKSNQRPLLAVLREADKRSDLNATMFSAAKALAAAARRADNFEIALEAWRIVERHVDGSGDDPALVKAQALTGQGLALFALHRDAEADKVLTPAISSLVPLAPESPDWSTVTLAERFLANAIALRGAERARLTSEARKLPISTSSVQRADLAGPTQRCPIEFEVNPMPAVPISAGINMSVGVIVMRLKVNPSGVVTDKAVLATFLDGDFSREVLDPRISYTVKPAKEAPHGCRIASNDQIISINFLWLAS
jgi:hypothetical protein